MRNDGYRFSGCRLEGIQEHVEVDVNLDTTLAEFIARDGLKVALAALMLHAFELGLISASLVQRRMHSTTGLAMGMGLRH